MESLPPAHQTPRPPSDEDVMSFWAWFESVAERLGQDFDCQALLDELDKRISQLGDICWELGPGRQAENALVVTPDGAKEWLPVTQRIVALAPVVPGWEFHPARQPKDWNLQYAIEDVSGETLDIDARRWRYVLFRFPDGKFDIVVEENNLIGADDEDRYAAAVILVDGILGEATRLLRIRDIEPVAILPPEQAAKASSVTDLGRHLSSLETS